MLSLLFAALFYHNAQALSNEYRVFKKYRIDEVSSDKEITDDIQYFNISNSGVIEKSLHRQIPQFGYSYRTFYGTGDVFEITMSPESFIQVFQQPKYNDSRNIKWKRCSINNTDGVAQPFCIDVERVAIDRCGPSYYVVANEGCGCSPSKSYNVHFSIDDKRFADGANQYFWFECYGMEGPRLTETDRFRINPLHVTRSPPVPNKLLEQTVGTAEHGSNSHDIRGPSAGTALICLLCIGLMWLIARTCGMKCVRDNPKYISDQLLRDKDEYLLV